MQEFKHGDILKHFKWETLSEEEKKTNRYLYKYIGSATHSETGEEMIVYEALYGDFQTYCRPKDLFYSDVDKRKYPDIQQETRFTKLY